MIKKLTWLFGTQDGYRRQIEWFGGEVFMWIVLSIFFFIIGFLIAHQP